MRFKILSLKTTKPAGRFYGNAGFCSPCDAGFLIRGRQVFLESPDGRENVSKCASTVSGVTRALLKPSTAGDLLQRQPRSSTCRTPRGLQRAVLTQPAPQSCALPDSQAEVSLLISVWSLQTDRETDPTTKKKARRAFHDCFFHPHALQADLFAWAITEPRMEAEKFNCAYEHTVYYVVIVAS